MYSVQKTVDLYWYNKEPNFGDKLNPYLIPKLFGVKVRWVNFSPGKQKTFAIGSILAKADRFTTVWGSGFISDTSRLSGQARILAVRGPLTHAKLTKLGIHAPRIYGDPALLLPLVYSPVREKKWKVGIIPHYVDKKSAFIKASSSLPGVKIIDVQAQNVESVINDILSCDTVVSSCLHGIITADAYGIPNVWIKISNGVIGGNFKFNDYFKSVGRSVRNPIQVNQSTNVFDLVKSLSTEKIKFDSSQLIKSNPFT